MSATEILLQAGRDCRTETVLFLLRVFENGDHLGTNGNHVSGTELIGGEDVTDRFNRVREIRRQLIERDLYQQLYGPLPFKVGADGIVRTSRRHRPSVGESE